MAAAPHRFLDMFPPGLDVTSIQSKSPYSFDSEQLYNTFTRGYDPEKHIESTLVKSVRYCKHTKGVQHEFILVEIEDIKVPLINYIVLDRTISQDYSGITIQRPFRRKRTNSSIQSYCGPAVDAFRVSYNGNKEQLLKACQLQPCRDLEEIEFTRVNPVYLYQLVTLVHVVSGRTPNYDLSGKNCYWFAGLVWGCLLSLRPDSRYDSHLSENNRGRLAVIYCAPEEKEVTETCNAFEEQIQKVDKALSESRKVRLSV
ncbi:hypothetical protein RHS04_08479 [Rhizoctonia solani]|uniref:Uncharacterized protein n=1 Tax=Rhizoctonia solani TaxID=456999 RepID=A0A8H7LGH2_9AGAM|nr:hypothetical protein RHS04_08479 [Rhizoctonia solani]